MGKKNPIKQVVQAASDIAHNPAREVARAVGADGIVKGIDKWKDTRDSIGIGIVDLANDEKGKQKKKQEAEQAKQGEIARVANEAEAARQSAAATAAIEAERMGAGSRSRTLLTGPAGLEDEEMSQTRRTLSGSRRRA